VVAVERRLELLKREGLGFSQPEIVKELSESLHCSERTVYHDFEGRERWQPELQHVENHSRILMKIVNRYERALKQLLGHKNIQSTMVYIHLEAAIFADRNDEFQVVVAKNTQEACKIVKVGFEYVTGDYEDGGKIFRKRK
jgi:transcriptional antiterminator